MTPELVVLLVNSQALRGWLEPALATKGIPYIRHIMGRFQVVHADESTDVWLRHPVVTAPSSLRTLPWRCDLFRKCAPGADIRIFFAPAAPWLDAEAQCALLLTAGRPRHLQALLTENLRRDSINACLDRLYTDFGRECVNVFKGWEEPCTPAALLHAFFTGTGLGSAEEAAAIASLVYPSAPRLVPRLDVLRFMEAINFLFTNEVTQDIFTWRGQRAFLQGGTGAEHIMPPSQRARLLNRLLAEEGDAPQHLEIISFLEQEARGLEGQQDTLERRDDLRPENARRLAELLDPDFARWILDAPHKPEESRRFVSRVCLEALRQVHGKVSAKPPKARPKVSVLTLTYNHEKYIEETIKSVLMQETNFEIEHIILDNGSSDETSVIIKDYASTHKQIRPIIPGYGEPHAVLWLFEAARAPYVALCEGDDYFTDPQKLQMQADFLDEHTDCALCFHPVLVRYENHAKPDSIFPSGQSLPSSSQQAYYFSHLMNRNFIQTNSVMYRWAFRHGLPVWFRGDMVPGDWFWHLIHAENGKIGFLDRVMSVYRRHPKAQYYDAAFDAIGHRVRVAKTELDLHQTVYWRFGAKGRSAAFRCADGIFAAVFIRCRESGDMTQLEDLAKEYPVFAGHFLASLQKESGAIPSERRAGRQ